MFLERSSLKAAFYLILRVPQFNCRMWYFERYLEISTL